MEESIFSEEFFLVFKSISNIFFLVEFFLRFQIGYYFNGKLIKDKRMIANNYKKTCMI